MVVVESEVLHVCQACCGTLGMHLVISEYMVNLCCGCRFFVTPSDSVAIIAANAVGAIPYFSGGLKGVARWAVSDVLLLIL